MQFVSSLWSFQPPCYYIHTDESLTEIKHSCQIHAEDIFSVRFMLAVYKDISVLVTERKHNKKQDYALLVTKYFADLLCYLKNESF